MSHELLRILAKEAFCDWSFEGTGIVGDEGSRRKVHGKTMLRLVMTLAAC
ncbi:hypothetical protein JHK87_000868 [Glycine soja]|nr:hypothetical protein JHK87_000868 [Glycine soja]